MSPENLNRLPWRVFIGFVGATVVIVLAGLLGGWHPRRELSSVILPIYGAVLLGVLSCTYVISGNTLVHHFRTGTIQRSTSPRSFWTVVVAQLAIAVVMAVIGCLQWSKLYG
jgi:multisubunit Na+/H+ antiporter MnhB subunit